MGTFQKIGIWKDKYWVPVVGALGTIFSLLGSYLITLTGKKTIWFLTIESLNTAGWIVIIISSIGIFISAIGSVRKNKSHEALQRELSDKEQRIKELTDQRIKDLGSVWLTAGISKMLLRQQASFFESFMSK